MGNHKTVEKNLEVLTGVIRDYNKAGAEDRALIKKQNQAMGADMQKAITRAIRRVRPRLRLSPSVLRLTLPGPSSPCSSRSPTLSRTWPIRLSRPSRAPTRRLPTTTFPSRRTLLPPLRSLPSTSVLARAITSLPLATSWSTLLPCLLSSPRRLRASPPLPPSLRCSPVGRQGGQLHQQDQ